MKWIKTITAGLTASLAMYAFIYIGIYVTGFAPFNVPPSAAFLYKIGINVPFFALLLHFIYGTFWAIILISVLEENITVTKVLIVALALWFFMMFVYSPLIGWGFWGFGNAYLLNSDHPLYLEGGSKYLVLTLFLHLIYGLVLGWLSSRWIMNDSQK